MNTGIDIIQINRFNNISEISKNKIFNESELKYINEHNKVQTIAGMFAAKEAMLKAIKKGINNYSLKDIEILHDDNSAPYIKLNGELEAYNNYDISLSISHDGDYAIAIVSFMV